MDISYSWHTFVWSRLLISLRIFSLSAGSRTFALVENCPPDNFPLDDCPLRIIGPQTISPEDNCPWGKNYPTGKFPRHHKFPPKIIALTQVRLKEYYERMDRNYGLSTSTIIKESFHQKVISQGSKLGVKSYLLPSIFYRFLTKPCRKSLIREQLSLNASWFSYARTQKNTIFCKNWFGKKCKKNSQWIIIIK